MTENIEQAAHGGDMLIWSVMFGLLIVVVIGLAIWDKSSTKE